MNDDDLLNEATQVIYYIEDGVVARYVYTYSHIYFHFECILLRFNYSSGNKELASIIHNYLCMVLK